MILLATDIPWMRAREMWIHAVDLDVGASFADMPAPMLAELITDVAARAGRQAGLPGAAPRDGDRRVATLGEAATGRARSPAGAGLAAWLLGRTKGGAAHVDGARRRRRWL